MLGTSPVSRLSATLALGASVSLLLAACGGGGTQLITGQTPIAGVKSKTRQAGQKLGFPAVATKNTTRVAGADPVADAAGVALAVFPSTAPGTHPSAVAIAPTDNWQAAIASSVLMAAPIKAPLLLSGTGRLPKATGDALAQLAPSGKAAGAAAEVIRVGDVPAPPHLRSVLIGGSDPFELA